MLAGIVVVVVIRATAVGADWTDVFRGQAINIASGALLAGFAYFLYYLRFRRAELSRYLERVQVARGRANDANALDPLARTIVTELLDARPPRACLIKGPLNSEHSLLLTDVAAQLAEKRRVPVVLDLRSGAAEASLAELARDRFVTQLVGASGDATNGRRLYSSLVKKEKVVALVRGLDQVGQGMPLASRRGVLAELLAGSLAEQIPFVAWVREDLAPSISEVAAFRAPPMSDDEFVRHVRQRLLPRAGSSEGDLAERLEEPFRLAFDRVEPTRDLALINVALDVLVRRVRAGEDLGYVLTCLFDDPCLSRRHLRWMCDWALGVALENIAGADSAAAVALAAIGREAHYQKEPELTWDDTSRGLDPEDRRRFAAGVATLSQRDVVTVSGSGGGRMIRFTDPMWFAFAGMLGLGLNRDAWRDLLQSGAPVATLNALTGSLMAFRSRTPADGRPVSRPIRFRRQRMRPKERSFVGVLREVGLVDEARISLEMILAVVVALQAEEEPLDMDGGDVAVLQKAWSASTDIVRLRFVRLVDIEREPVLIGFLWAQVDFPRFDENTFRIRRAICTRLGSLGDPAWQRLNPRWLHLTRSADGEDLSTSARNTPRWRQYENPLASLGWVLPGLLATMTEDTDAAYRLLDELRAFQDPGSVPPGVGPPDIGLEISLAEGFKAAAVEAFSRGSNPSAALDASRQPGPDQRWWGRVFDLLDTARSWAAQQALLQVLALAPPGIPSREVLYAWTTSADRHPFARETAGLAERFADRDDTRSATTAVEGDIWFEAVEALEDGGVSLSPEAHRLLGLSTLLINLAEWRLEERDHDVPTEEALEMRERVLAGTELPACFGRPAYAATIFQVSCPGNDACPFRLCGEASLDGVVGAKRVFSRSFVQRAEVTANPVPPATTRIARLVNRVRWSVTRSDRGRLFVTKAFGPVWSSLDEQLRSREGAA
jgi:hypothetical protein